MLGGIPVVYKKEGKSQSIIPGGRGIRGRLFRVEEEHNYFDAIVTWKVGVGNK